MILINFPFFRYAKRAKRLEVPSDKREAELAARSQLRQNVASA
jgi:hypothetical protein